MRTTLVPLFNTAIVIITRVINCTTRRSPASSSSPRGPADNPTTAVV